ncbi:MAG: MarR family winged helix-turn-helix transcriptional regulator [Thermoproteota archaeon]|nr:MarR family winged helix-turn-helix transcriptional regulator [Thermoproteota archaeon]
MTESPKHFMVLDAISQGYGAAGKIAKVTKISKDEVEMMLNDLVVQKLVVAEQKKGYFGRKTLVRITEIGSRLLSFKKQELEQKFRDLESKYMKRDRGGIESFMDNNRAWIPMMIFSGVMSAVMFASMISFMGMTMNPVESAMAEDAAVNTDAQDVADTQSAAEDNTGFASNGGGDTSIEDLSSFDSSGSGDFGGGDFEF